MDLNLRRVTLFAVIIVPLVTLFLLLLGITYTQAALLQKNEGRPAPSGTSYHRQVSLPLADPISRGLFSTPAKEPMSPPQTHLTNMLSPTSMAVSVGYRYGIEFFVFTLACTLCLLFSILKIFQWKTH